MQNKHSTLAQQLFSAHQIFFYDFDFFIVRVGGVCASINLGPTRRTVDIYTGR